MAHSSSLFGSTRSNSAVTPSKRVSAVSEMPAAVLQDFRIADTDHNGDHLGLIAKHLLNVRHMHFQAVLILLIFLGKPTEFPALLQLLHNYIRHGLLSLSTFRFPRGVCSSSSPEIVQPSKYFLCDGPTKNILLIGLLSFSSWRYRYAQAAFGPL